MYIKTPYMPDGADSISSEGEPKAVPTCSRQTLIPSESPSETFRFGVNHEAILVTEAGFPPTTRSSVLYPHHDLISRKHAVHGFLHCAAIGSVKHLPTLCPPNRTWAVPLSHATPNRMSRCMCSDVQVSVKRRCSQVQNY